jgi:hypothetical protein
VSGAPIVLTDCGGTRAPTIYFSPFTTGTPPGRCPVPRVLHRHVSRSLLAALLIGLLLALPSTPTVHATGNIQYVFSYLDSPGALTDCRDIATGCSLRDALNAAADGDTIQFAHSTAWPITYTLTHGTLVVGHAVTIQGPGADALQISGGGAVGVFVVNSGVTATISGLGIENGRSTIGGGINNQGTLTVTSSTLSGNVATRNGAGISNSGTLTVTGSTLSGNSATSDSVLSSDGGGISNSGTVTVTDSTLTGNFSNDLGGGIFNQVTLTVTGSTLSGNHAFVGGGIANEGTATLTSSTLSGNHGSHFGGGIWSARVLTVTNTTLASNGSQTGGGIANDGTLTLTNATLAGNTATSGGGGISASTSTNTTAQATILANPSGGDCAGVPLTSHDGNVASDTSCAGLTAAHDRTGLDPGLDPAGLRDNSGPTATIALALNSPAIGAGGPCAAGVTTDQRGLPRVGNCDVGAYAYQPVTPTLGDAVTLASGGSVTFHGSGFQTGSQLTIDSTLLIAPASAVSADGTQMTLAAPAHTAGVFSSRLLNPGDHGTTATFTYVPFVTSVTPASGSAAGGGSVTITGAGFVASGTSVTFGNAPATVTNVTAKTVTITTPAHVAGTVDVTVIMNGMSATKPGAYSYVTVTAVPPPQPPGSGTGSPATLPGSRPVGPSVQTGSPNPLPTGR